MEVATGGVLRQCSRRGGAAVYLKCLVVRHQHTQQTSCLARHQHTTSYSVHYGLEKKWTYYNQEAVDREAAKHVRLLTPTQLMFAGQSHDGSHLLKSSQFLHSELPRRIARRVQDFQSLPYVVALNPTLQGVYELYLRAFDKLSRFPPITTLEEQLSFNELLKKLLDDHQDVVTSLAKAFHEVKNLISYDILGSLTERTLVSRLGIRLLAEHHIGLACAKKPKYIGVVYTNMSPKSIIERCVYSCKRMCEHTYGRSPGVYVSGHTKARFAHIPGPIEYILMEVLKNAMKAVTHHHSGTAELPPIMVTICNNETDFMIRVSDQGGGIPDSGMSDIFKYSFSTTAEEESRGYIEGKGSAFENFVKASNTQPFGGSLSGYGFGIPSSRAYAKFLGGTLEVIPMYGLGTDVFIRLSHINKQNSFRI